MNRRGHKSYSKLLYRCQNGLAVCNIEETDINTKTPDDTASKQDNPPTDSKKTITPQNILNEIICTKIQIDTSTPENARVTLTTTELTLHTHSPQRPTSSRCILDRPKKNKGTIEQKLRGSNEHSAIYLPGPWKFDEVPKRT